MRLRSCLLIFVGLVTACGSATAPGALESVSATRPTAPPRTRAQISATETQLQTFVESVRAKLGDDFVSTEGGLDEQHAVNDLDVILLDSSTAHLRVSEVRDLFAATAPSIAPHALRFTFAPVSEKRLLAAYESLSSALEHQQLDLASLNRVTVDRASGALVVTLDGTKHAAATGDEQELGAWGKSVTPISVKVTIAPHPDKFVLP